MVNYKNMEIWKPIKGFETKYKGFDKFGYWHHNI